MTVWVPLVPLRTGSKLGISPLMLAAMNGHTQAAKLLLDHGADINAQVGGAGRGRVGILYGLHATVVAPLHLCQIV